MYDHQKHYRPVYLARATDQELEQRANVECINKQMLINRYVREGLERPSPGKQAAAPEQQGAFLISDGFYLDGMLIGPLENRAMDAGCSIAELLRRFIDEGLALPPKEQAVTRRLELSTLKANRLAYHRRAIEAARPFLDAAAKITEQISVELKALRACCRHTDVLELKGSVSVYSCVGTCGDVDRHMTRARLCADCGIFEGTCSGRHFRYGWLSAAKVKDVGYDEFAGLRNEFLTYIDDR